MNKPKVESMFQREHYCTSFCKKCVASQIEFPLQTYFPEIAQNCEEYLEEFGGPEIKTDITKEIE